MAICKWLEVDSGACTSPEIGGRLEGRLILNQDVVSDGLFLCQACITYSLLAKIEAAQTGKIELGDGTRRVCIGYESS